MNITSAQARAIGIKIPPRDPGAAFKVLRSAKSNMMCGDSMTPRPRINPKRASRCFYVYVSTPNPLNGSHGRHWATTARRKEQRTRTATAMLAGSGDLPPLPACVSLTRYSRGSLDDDAVPAALKSIRDQIADAYGIADNDPRISFKYFQERELDRERGPSVLVIVYADDIAAREGKGL
jgi:hypothetical protein